MKSGRIGPHGRDHPHHERQVARRILDADDARELGQPPDRGHVDRAGEHRDVVERDVDGRVARDLAEVGVDRFGAELVVERRDDGHRAGAEAGVGLAGGERLPDVGLGGAGQHRHAPAGLFADDLDDPPALLGGEAGELAGRAVRIQPVDAVLDQPVDVAAQFGLVDLPALVQRDQGRCEDAFELGGHENSGSTNTSVYRIGRGRAPRAVKASGCSHPAAIRRSLSKALNAPGTPGGGLALPETR